MAAGVSDAAKRHQQPCHLKYGRLFDAVAALTGLHTELNFEGQAAMGLEFAAGESTEDHSYPVHWCATTSRDLFMLDIADLCRHVVSDVEAGQAVPDMARRFHLYAARVIVAAAQRIGLECVALSGGCFQNVLLLEQAVCLCKQQGVSCYRHQRVPPDDGGIALGQAVAAANEGN